MLYSAEDAEETKSRISEFRKLLSVEGGLTYKQQQKCAKCNRGIYKVLEAILFSALPV